MSQQRLDAIVDRNRRALRPRRSWLSYVVDEIHDAFDTSLPVEERRPKQVALGVIALIIAGAIATYLLWPHAGNPGGKVQSRHGDTVELSSLWAGRRTVVVFYPGKGCDCDFALKDLEAHRAQFDANLIAISSHTAEYADELHERLELGYEIYVDPRFKVIPKWGVPFAIADATSWAIFIVEPNGTISFKKIGGPLPTWDQVASMTRTSR